MTRLAIAGLWQGWRRTEQPRTRPVAAGAALVRRLGARLRPSRSHRAQPPHCGACCAANCDLGDYWRLEFAGPQANRGRDHAGWRPPYDAAPPCTRLWQSFL